MAFLDTVKELITNKPPNLKKPYFMKIDSDAQNQLEQLQDLLLLAPIGIKQRIEQDMKMLAYGIAGEENVAFELNNSYLPIIVLKDLHFVYEGLSAQIDFLVITPKFQLVIECKNLFGNIEVNSQGDFIRTIEYNGHIKREGIYSPITQNIRHLEMIKKIRLASRNNILSKAIFEKYFDENYKSVVVLANPKTIVNLKYAKKEIKDQIIRCDQLTNYIKQLTKLGKQETSLEKQMYEMAEYFIKYHMPYKVDYAQKYRDLILTSQQELNEHLEAAAKSDNNMQDTKDSTSLPTENEPPVYLALKQYRLIKSRQEGIKAYYIFNNVQLDELVKMMPNTNEELSSVSGFGPMKCEKYGADILEIVAKFRK